ncbi:hypothetical protein DM02DRAFT_656464 [Periconia macrospinosa]|uniref:Rhodopsin domain-containing protein n=1 Tax=Periconia macrospinosa TaxID=97972 RepID=A0A2V1DNH8_9PLEO|nr:hypothetical protein DM02DRAFT_656464 [Periconia macrospinosa]
MAMKLPPGVPIEDIPLIPPPHGQKPDFNAPAHAVKSLVILNAVWLALMITVVSIRFISRQLISKQKFALDDALCLIATAGSIVHSALLFANVKLGYGQHMYNVRLISMTPQRLLQIQVVETIYVVIIYLVKLSILALFYRLFNASKSARILVYFGLAFCTIITIPFFGVAVSRNVRCNGPKALSEPVCLAKTTSLTTVIYSALNVVSDFYILLIPIRQLQGLHMQRRRKMGLIVLFMVGFVACGMSVIRLGFLASEYGIGDQFYSIALVSHFTTVEINLAIICSCLVFFPSFIRTGKTSAESAFRYLLSKTGKSKSQVQIPDDYEQPPPRSSRSGDWQKFQPPTTFEEELQDLGNARQVSGKDPVL